MSGFFDLNGKLALVTGSSHGIGFSIARGLGLHGATVMLNARNREQLAEAAGRLGAEKIAAHTAAFDVTDARQIEDAVTEIEQTHGGIDILINNAGLQIRAPLLEYEEKTWHEMIDANLTSAFLLSRKVAAGMVARKSGRIINICSLMSEVGRPTIAPYTAAKGGLKMLTRAMAVEWAPHNVQVNGIGPGYFATEMNTALVENREFNDWICRRTPMGRWGRTDELAGAAIFLASPASSFMTGQILYIDGGVLASL